MKKKIILFFLILITSIFFLIKYNVEHNTFFFQKYKNIFPQYIKNEIRRTLTFLNSLSIDDKQNFILKKTDKKNLKSKTLNKDLSIFTNSNLIFTGPRAYFASNNDRLFIVTGTGILMSERFDLIDLNKEKINFKTIKTNLDKYLFEYKKKNSKSFFTSAVKSILLLDKEIYISLITKSTKRSNIIHKSNNCFRHEILKGKLNLKKIKFQPFFKINDCRPVYHDYVGGTLSDYKDDKILYTVGDFAVCEHPSYISETNSKYCEENNSQVMKSYLGKILEININNGSSSIISLGHDNPQGLYYDKINDLIISTEHGPSGGDEINLNISPSKNDIKNYGYPIASYGEHYGFPDESINYLYKLAPLHKSHAKFGFIEPVKYFVTSIGISPIDKYKKKIFVGSLGSDIEEGDLSIHTFDMNKKFELINHEVFEVYNRVRDIHVVNNINKIFFFFETTGSIGIIDMN